MNVIYIGGLPPKHLNEEIRHLGSYVDYAGITFQSSLLDGLYHWFPHLAQVNGMRVDAWPKVRRIWFKPQVYSYLGEGDPRDRFVGVLNIPLLNRIYSFFAIRKAIISQLKKDEENVVILYSLSSIKTLVLASIHRRISRSCYVVPDLPEFMSENNSFYRKLAKKLDTNIIYRNLKYIDSFVLLSPYMAERLPIEGKPWKQMEGIYQKPLIDLSITRTTEKAILYTGVLGKRYGIIDLLDAFNLIDDPNYRLWIRGGGAIGKAEILFRAKIDPRISYIEPLSKEDLLKLHRRASVLVNPVKRSEQFTRYYFPSKTMEYLASGTPVVMYHLDCIPSEYDSYLNYVEEETIESLRDKILEVCEGKREEATERASRAAKFIVEKKNAKVQTKVIYDLICLPRVSHN